MRIKINLTNGNVSDKKLITAFKTDSGMYIVFDNETVGSMGLPIILVAKMNESSLVKIIDQNEWEIVKESLKTIISGDTIEFIKPNLEYSAEELFYTQLTLPITSFDALKNAYTIKEEITEEQKEVEEAPSIDEAVLVAPTPPEVEAVQVAPEEPAAPEPIINEAPTFEASEEINPVLITPEANVAPEVAPVSNIETPQKEEETPPVVGPVINEDIMKDEDYSEMKKSFMQACENIFEALVVKFKDKNK